MEYTFENMPKILKRIEARLDKIEELLLDRIQREFPEIEFVGSQEACEILKISLPTLYSKVCLREIPFYKKGNRLHFSKAELIDWIQEGKRKTTQQISENGEELLKKLNRQNGNTKYLKGFY